MRVSKGRRIPRLDGSEHKCYLECHPWRGEHRETKTEPTEIGKMHGEQVNLEVPSKGKVTGQK